MTETTGFHCAICGKKELPMGQTLCKDCVHDLKKNGVKEKDFTMSSSHPGVHMMESSE
jgi:predicted nucleic acid-binding Zn ribbon protein